jgi:tRNA A-37 threonylcarbamoyl transferase component Bud32
MDSGALIPAWPSTENPRVFRTMLDGVPVWIKRVGAPKQNRWNRLHRVLSVFLRGLFRPTAARSHAASLHDEMERLRSCFEQGLPVPRVLHFGDGFLVLEDCGEPLPARLQREGMAARIALLSSAMATLAAFHQRGFCHGRPFMKDMTIRDDVIHFLDLEENPLAQMSLAKAQARDVWLFLVGAMRFTAEPAALAPVLAAYRQAGDGEVRRELRRFVRLIRPVRILVSLCLMRVAGSDLRRAVAANVLLEKALLGPADRVLPA